MEFITDPFFFAVAIPAVLIAGVSKSGFGGGLGVIAVPLMALAVSPQAAAAIMLPILCLMDLANVWAYRKRWDRRNMLILVPAALIGILIGVLTFSYLSVAVVKLIIATIAIVFTLDHWLRGKKAGDSPKSATWGKGSVLGSLAGFTSFVAHAGGPPVSVFLLPQRLDKSIFVGTTVMFFIVVNYVKLVPYWFLGQFSSANLGTSAVLVPVALFGTWLGLWAHDKVNVILFYRVCYCLLFFTGLKLLWDAVVLMSA
ncbi:MULTISPECIES: sulfite exporter TauE/SafE family protein [Thalassospira]|uniref:Probable membrane transporter protein n=2 Tax=Thalassospira TaxID=168934 RepID=A0A367W5H1_9PROT|nr:MULTISPECIES: sulfite exporter TauE/SafE family protein [Thalassospira]MDG4720981.1 sulfite exporter TauE/SafE family protein [Thalassospira sp. FZY0004]RCK36637.1 membrane protein [Thalassospira profundimaris]